MRTGILAMLLVVLPLQSVGQLVAGIQGQGHLHTGAAPGAGLASLRGALRAMLDQLHAAQAPRLKLQEPAWLPSSGPAAGLHEHGGVYHQHSDDTNDVLAVATDRGDDSLQGGATVFQAWMPAGLAVPPAVGAERPLSAGLRWRDRVPAPPLMPPRG